MAGRSVAVEIVAAVSLALDCTHVSQHFDGFLVACGPCVHKGMDRLAAALTTGHTRQEEPRWCETHQHFKWCQCNGGVFGLTGWEAPGTRQETKE